MTTKQTGQRSFSGLWFILAGVIGLWLLCMLCSLNFVKSGTSKTNAIFNNFRQLDGAKQPWAPEHGRTGAVVRKRRTSPRISGISQPWQVSGIS